MNEAVMDAVALLRVPRSALGICASSRGAVVGCLLLRERPESPWVDCTLLGTEGWRSQPAPCLARCVEVCHAWWTRTFFVSQESRYQATQRS